MALTVGTTAPPSPYGGRGGSGHSGLTVMSMHVEGSASIAVGDIIIHDLTTGKVNQDNTPPTVALVLGIAFNSATGSATALDSEVCEFIPATPGQMFDFSAVDNATTDYVPNFADLGDSFDTLEHADGYPLIDMSDAAVNILIPIGFSPFQLRGETFVSGASGTVNPRVTCVFKDTFFTTLAA